ncbi:MAG: type II toxin-antitoxin system RelE/ParE family toxin [Epsilonproteobacteria bacterium]|nr:MAG: type II toxin-antitoxin system RelE/ParE family toxin [Campylobacterota bacterium]
MYKVKKSTHFGKWLDSLKDLRGKIAIARRIERMGNGNFGDMKSVGDGISELRITVGPAYRVYFTKFDDRLIVLLVGGDKSTQSKDIKKAKMLLEEIKDES